MNKRAVRWIVSTGLLAGLALSAWVVGRRVAVDFAAAVAVNRPPQIRPDYRDAVLPPNIAPLNFLVEEPGTAYAVRVRSAEGEPIDVVSRTPRIVIPPSRWRRLLGANRGGTLYFDVCARRADGQWERFEPIENTVADADCDRYLFYRLIKPIHVVYADVAIYQRDLTTYEQSLVVSNRSFGGRCVNCHSFSPHHPDRMILQCRGSKGGPDKNGMVVVRGGEVVKVDTRALPRDAESQRGRITQSKGAYASWHPDGRVVAFSANKISQFFHAVGEVRDVFDEESDLALYDAQSNTVTTTPEISRPDRLETLPTWSPDGRYLYFCSADPAPVERYREVRYDLMRIGYDAASGQWGDLEPVLLAEDTGLSITEPRVSPDGRWLLFCMSDYGAFPVYQDSCDLYLLNLDTRQHHRLSVNSPRSDCWHCWSRNGRWIAFASKRRDGVFARIYFSYVDEEGRAHKPVLLPQKDPSFYDRFIKTYNVPELSPTPVPASARALARAIRSEEFFGPSKPATEAGMRSSDVP
jgi:hypothetical protein